MLNFLFNLASSVECSLTLNTLTIRGSGIITQEIVRSVGSFTEFKKIIIEEGPTEIDDLAFKTCSKVEYIKIPKSVKIIGNSVFRFCSSLKTIEVSSDSTSFCTDSQGILYSYRKKILYRFPINNDIKHFDLPEGLEEVLSDAFCSNQRQNFGDIVFPSSIKSFRDATFDSGRFNSISFKSVSNLKTLCGFKYCYIGTLTIPNSVTKIANNGLFWAEIGILKFEENSNLKTINSYSFRMFYTDVIDLPESVETIEGSAFENCNAKTIKIGTKCSNINGTAFSGCQKLSSVEIKGESSYYASFGGVLMDSQETNIIFIPLDLTTITIKSTVTEIARSSLQNSIKLKDIVLDGNTKWQAESGVLYSSDYTHLVAVCGGIDTINIRSEVTNIDVFAACGCKLLTTVNFVATSKVESIGEHAFQFSAVKRITLPNSVKTIKGFAFDLTVNLTTFEVEDKEGSLLERIEWSCFKDSHITSFYFGKNVNYVGGNAFLFCYQLKSLSFHDNIQLTTFDVQSFQRAALETLNLPSSITTIPSNCFYQCHSLKKVTFKDNSQLTKIGDFAFSECIRLASVVLQDKCTEIGILSFSKCPMLSTFTNKLETIGNGAFLDCTSLPSFVFSPVQKRPDPGVFRGCSTLTSFSMTQSNQELMVERGILFNVDTTELVIFPPGKEMAIIPQKTLSFSANAFAWSPKLRYVIFEAGSDFTTIGEASFYECKVLLEVQFPPRLRIIGKNSFYGCKSIRTIILPNTLESIGSGAFKSCLLSTVKYCGDNEVTGTDVFESSVGVLVTDLYQQSTFCERPAEKKLSYNCDFKPGVLQTCNNHYNIFSSIYFSILIFLND